MQNRNSPIGEFRFQVVEVAGIEPASFGPFAWLLRVQLVVNFLQRVTASAWPAAYLVSFRPAVPRPPPAYLSLISPFDRPKRSSGKDVAELIKLRVRAEARRLFLFPAL